MSRVLIIEDEVEIADLEKDYLELSGFEVEIENDGTVGLKRALTEDFDMYILDLMLPGIDGFEICKQIREEKNTPILMVSAKKDDIDKIRGLGLGADDYITKPFRPLVLGAKVKALIRRTKNMGNHSDTIQCGPFTYESSTMRFYKDGEELILSSKESALLLLFIKHPGQVYTKDMIYEQVWGTTIAIDDNAIMVYINRLRSKIEKDRQKPEHIITVRGMGYRFLP